jgi:lipopolysaccharide biosynthesis regulator YciM
MQTVRLNYQLSEPNWAETADALTHALDARKQDANNATATAVCVAADSATRLAEVQMSRDSEAKASGVRAEIAEAAAALATDDYAKVMDAFQEQLTSTSSALSSVLTSRSVPSKTTLMEISSQLTRTADALDNAQTAVGGPGQARTNGAHAAVVELLRAAKKGVHHQRNDACGNEYVA